MPVKPVPDNYPRVTPYLSIDGAAAAIEFYKKAYGATERMRMDAPGGKVGHAESRSKAGSSCSPTSIRRWSSARRRR